MTTKRRRSTQSLRHLAEEMLASGTITPPSIHSLDDATKLLHHLQVNQIELEMQNEELRRTQVELESMRSRYVDIYEQAPVSYLITDDKGLVQESNITAAKLLGVQRNALCRKPFLCFILAEDQTEFALCSHTLLDSGLPQACEVRMLRNEGVPFWAHLELTVMQESESHQRCHIVLSDISERKFREERMFVAQHLTQPMLESGMIGIMTFAANGRCRSINQVMAQQLGSTCEQLMTRNVRELEFWRKSGLLEAVDEALASGSERQLEIHLLSLAGKEVWMSCKLVPYKERGHWLVLLLAMDSGNTKPMINPSELAIPSFGGLFNTTMDIEYQLDMEGRILSIRPSLWSISGYTNEEIIGRNIRSLDVAPDRWAEFMSQLQRDGSVKDWQLSVLAKDGSPVAIILDAKLCRNALGIPLCIEGVCHVRSESRQTERMKLTYADLLYTLIDTMSEAMTFSDARGHFWVFNAAMTQLTGYTLNEVNACPDFPRLLFPDTAEREQVVSLLSALHSDNIPEQIETTITTRTGARIDVLVTIRLLQYNNQRMFLTVFRDCTKRKQAQVRRRENEERYCTQLRALTSQVISAEMHERQRLATVLHDNIEQLLAVARLRVDMLVAEAPTAQLASNWHEMGALLQQIIAESRTMTFELFPPPLYESGIADGMRWLTRALSESTGIHMTLTTDVDFDHQHVTIRDFVYWSARELLLNVVKHSQARHAQVTLQQQDDHLIITVKDDGCGFVPPTRAVHSTSAGIGLFSISERLKLLGGSCTIDSAPGQGACITLSVAIDALRDMQMVH